jgi:hypothetical protein
MFSVRVNLNLKSETVEELQEKKVLLSLLALLAQNFFCGFTRTNTDTLDASRSLHT